jgi:hypothetical protein
MTRTKTKISYWYIVSGLLIIVSILWIYIDINKTPDPQDIIQEAEEVAEPINDSFNTDAIENIQRRKDLSDELLKDIDTYQSTAPVEQ